MKTFYDLNRPPCRRSPDGWGRDVLFASPFSARFWTPVHVLESSRYGSKTKLEDYAMSTFHLASKHCNVHGHFWQQTNSDWTAENSTWCRKFCPPKIMSAEILSDKVISLFSCITFSYFSHFWFLPDAIYVLKFLFLCPDKLTLSWKLSWNVFTFVLKNRENVLKCLEFSFFEIVWPPWKLTLSKYFLWGLMKKSCIIRNTTVRYCCCCWSVWGRLDSFAPVRKQLVQNVSGLGKPAILAQ